MQRIVLLLATTMGLVMLLAGVGVDAPGTSDLIQAQSAAAQTVPGAQSRSSELSGPSDSTELLQKAKQEGSVRVIVGLRVHFAPEGRLSRPAVADQQSAIGRTRAGLQAELRGTGYRTVREYDTVPYVALELSPQAFEAAQRSPRVTTIEEDSLDSAFLAQSAPIVQAPTMWEAGFTGAGQVVAILDTGVDSSHSFLSGKVVEEACYSNSNCPDGSATQTGAGSGVPCTYATSGCQHGTHVAGIAAGQGSDFSGVARGADIMAVQVFSQFTGDDCEDAGEDPCTLTRESDQIAGLERVYELRNDHNFSSVNMSLGGGQFFSNCDSNSRKAAIDNLRSVGIATVIASGNSGFTDSMGAPACISSAISVGSTTKSDAVSSFSNSASFLSLLAPGSSIDSSVPGGGFASFSGTSMATPHVAGAWALLKQQEPSASVSDVLSDLQNTGTPVTDTRVTNGVTKPRISISAAAGLTPPNDAFVNAQTLAGTSATVSGTNVLATKEIGEPNHAGNSGGKSVWYQWTPQLNGIATIDTATSDFDTLLGAYIGTAVNSLTRVASNNDDPNGGKQSKVSFPVTAGTTYRIAVDGYKAASGNTASGNIVLHLALAKPVALDIKPSTCPNPLSTADSGTYPVAILGTSSFDVSEVDPATVRLAGVSVQSGRKVIVKDVATPYSGTITNPPQANQCTTSGSDGQQDLNLKFDAKEVLGALGTVTNDRKEVRVVKLTGNLKDGTPIEGKDVVILNKGR